MTRIIRFIKRFWSDLKWALSEDSCQECRQNGYHVCHTYDWNAEDKLK